MKLDDPADRGRFSSALPDIRQELYKHMSRPSPFDVWIRDVGCRMQGFWVAAMVFVRDVAG